MELQQLSVVTGLPCLLSPAQSPTHTPNKLQVLEPSFWNLLLENRTKPPPVHTTSDQGTV